MLFGGATLALRVWLRRRRRAARLVLFGPSVELAVCVSSFLGLFVSLRWPVGRRAALGKVSRVYGNAPTRSWRLRDERRPTGSSG